VPEGQTDEGTVPIVSEGLSAAGLDRLHKIMGGQVRDGRVPGLVLGLRRGGVEHIDAIGTAEPAGSAPMRPDAIFRLTSMTRPVTAVATLLLVQDGRLELDGPIGRLLPELADRPVLRHPDSPLDDTVPADRPVTVRDLLTFRGGFGTILAPPSEYPILAAEQALELSSVGPPTPATPHGPDEWLRRMGRLPLMEARYPVAVQHRLADPRRTHHPGRGPARGRVLPGAHLRPAGHAGHPLRGPRRSAVPARPELSGRRRDTRAVRRRRPVGPAATIH
jgi:hypothetical protein